MRIAEEIIRIAGWMCVIFGIIYAIDIIADEIINVRPRFHDFCLSKGMEGYVISSVYYCIDKDGLMHAYSVKAFLKGD